MQRYKRKFLTIHVHTLLIYSDTIRTDSLVISMMICSNRFRAHASWGAIHHIDMGKMGLFLVHPAVRFAMQVGPRIQVMVEEILRALSESTSQQGLLWAREVGRLLLLLRQ